MDIDTMSPFSPADLRHVMRRWASGVAIVTAGSRERKVGLTATSFTSISIDPPLVSVTLDNQSQTMKEVEERGTFCINLLAADQRSIAELFATKGNAKQEGISQLPFFYDEVGVPILAASAAYLVCRVVHRFAAKNSTLYIGEVIHSMKMKDLPPLIYLNRGYHEVCE